MVIIILLRTSRLALNKTKKSFHGQQPNHFDVEERIFKTPVPTLNISLHFHPQRKLRLFDIILGPSWLGH